MKIKFLSLFCLSFLLLASCSKEAEAPTPEVTDPALETRAAERCFEYVYPVTYIMPDGSTITAESAEELRAAIRAWYANNPDSKMRPTLQYPVKVEFNGQIIVIENAEQMAELRKKCRILLDDKRFDCPGIRADFGDKCRTRDGKIGFVNKDCKCQAKPDGRYDCPEIKANFGDKCKTDDGRLGFINRDCKCQVRANDTFDCPEIKANFGDRCKTDDGKEGFINKDCKCQEKVANTYDCPDIKANFGDKCRKDDGTVGHINKDCKCE